MRFDNSVRLFGSLLFLLCNVSATGVFKLTFREHLAILLLQILWLPIVIYVPALSFNQATGVNVLVISVFVCLVCVFYTLLVSESDTHLLCFLPEPIARTH